MSSNQMVSVPRDELEAACQRFAKAQIFDFSRRMRALLAQPADQHQGEPVGEVVAFGKGLHEIAWAAGRMPKLGAKLYTSADPAEVERLRDENRRLREVIKHSDAQIMRQSMRISNQRAQLAKRDAPHPIRVLGQEAYSTLVGMVEFCLNKRACLGMDEGYKNFLDEEDEHDFVKELRTFVALSASAEPSAPIAWHVGGNGYDRICFEKPDDLPGRPCIQAIHDQRQLIDLLKRYDLRDEDVPPDERGHGIPGTSLQRLNALANEGE
ncbi:hypothetical protein [Pseudomonas shirazensis]|uniref:hypothetical protein n=1 Tax=Pseudomonas shirazensis TaxID=2745494 RepID=UPI001645849B|nr:hypothetical protein [Pseudomonas shirazensis]MBV4500424.1 hypothetical protein [Pseudomonas shirazensis]